MKQIMDRRQFIKRSAVVTAGAWLLGTKTSFGKISPNEKLNIACVGTAGRAWQDVLGVQGENIVALCDIDANNLAKAGEKFPQAKRYSDWRKLLDQKDIDAVVIGTPDHTHAVATVAALKSGRHV